MPAKDRYHDVVEAALIRDGWTVTHDPLTLRWGNKDMFVDLIQSDMVQVVVFSEETEEVLRWIP